MEQLQQSLAETLANGSPATEGSSGDIDNYMGQMAMTMGKLRTLGAFSPSVIFSDAKTPFLSLGGREFGFLVRSGDAEVERKSNEKIPQFIDRVKKDPSWKHQCLNQLLRTSTNSMDIIAILFPSSKYPKAKSPKRTRSRSRSVSSQTHSWLKGRSVWR
ncbi:hypothetical protein T459_30442 [Capsicum annuum]|uniref:Uncharacterized protein n=1 Tax=Capsicum annuum TaxID=4072 RepID=A0A2G2Y8D6_CAPAN|nr:hypothetical protein T459_30442 [Capsicum annuum]